MISDSQPQKVEYAGKTYYIPGKNKYGFTAKDPAIYLVNEKTILIGEEPVVKAMMDAKDVKTPLVELLGKVDPAACVSIVATPNDSVRKLTAAVKEKGNLPPPLQSFPDALDAATGSIIAIKMTPEISLSVTIENKDEAAAAKLAGLVPTAKQFAEQTATMLHQMAAAAPPDAKPLAEYGLDKLDKIIAGLKPEQNGKEVVIQIKGLGTVDELANLLGPAIVRSAGGSDADYGAEQPAADWDRDDDLREFKSIAAASSHILQRW